MHRAARRGRRDPAVDSVNRRRARPLPRPLARARARQLAVLDGLRPHARRVAAGDVVLLERALRRTLRMSVHQALLQLSPVETRLLVLFWHLAERWGRVTPDGICVRLRLSHELLGQLVGCRRASVTTALHRVATAAWSSATRTGTGSCAATRRTSWRRSLGALCRSCWVSGMCSLLMGCPRQRHELLACARVVSDQTSERGCHRCGPQLLDPAQRHAQVLHLEDHAHTLGRQLVVEPAGDLCGDALLELEVLAPRSARPRGPACSAR